MKVKTLHLDFYEKGGVYWIKATFVGDNGEKDFEISTECDADRITIHLLGDVAKQDWN